MKNVHKLTEGAILLAAFIVLLLITLYVPILGAVMNLFLSLPYILFAAKNNRTSMVVFLLASVIISFIFGTFLALPLTLSYGLTGLVIGDFIKNKKGKGAAFMAGSLMFLFTLVVQYAIAVAFFKVDFIQESIDLFKVSIEQSVSMLKAIGQKPNEAILQQFNAGIDLLQTITPSLFVMISFTAVFMIQLVSIPIVKRFGVEVTGWKPFRELTLPKSLIFYFLISFLLSLIVNSENGGYLYVAVVNIIFVLQLLLLIQGLSFIWYYFYTKGFPKAAPIIITILMFVIPILLYIVWILGIIDLGFDLRKRLSK